MKYKTNFYQGKKGNSIKGGATLIVSVPGATVLTGTLAKRRFLFKKFLQIQQGTNELKFLLKKKRKGKTVPFGPGKYELNIKAYDAKNLGHGWKDVFWID